MPQGLFATASLAAAILSRVWAVELRITHKDRRQGIRPMKKIRIAINTFSELVLEILFKFTPSTTENYPQADDLKSGKFPSKFHTQSGLVIPFIKQAV